MAIKHIPDGGDFFGPEHAADHRAFGFTSSVPAAPASRRAAPGGEGTYVNRSAARAPRQGYDLGGTVSQTPGGSPANAGASPMQADAGPLSRATISMPANQAFRALGTAAQMGKIAGSRQAVRDLTNVGARMTAHAAALQGAPGAATATTAARPPGPMPPMGAPIAGPPPQQPAMPQRGVVPGGVPGLKRGGHIGRGRKRFDGGGEAMGATAGDMAGTAGTGGAGGAGTGGAAGNGGAQQVGPGTDATGLNVGMSPQADQLGSVGAQQAAAQPGFLDRLATNWGATGPSMTSAPGLALMGAGMLAGPFGMALTGMRGAAALANTLGAQPQTAAEAAAQAAQNAQQGGITGGGASGGPLPTNPYGGYAEGGHITAAERHALPKSEFALPGERYPIDTPGRARNALARGAQNASPSEQKTIARKVHARFPSIGKK